MPKKFVISALIIFASLIQLKAQESDVSINHEGNLIPAMIYFKFYMFRALQKAGLGSEYPDQLGPWKKMINLGLTTFAEKDTEPRSKCHAWSASPCFDFLHTIAGIRPGKPGFKTVIIEPNLGQLESIKVKFPHPEGTIELQIQKETGKPSRAFILMPDNVQGEFIWNRNRSPLLPGYQEIELE